MRLPWIVLGLLLAGATLAAPVRYVFPNDPAVADARRDFGAVGDGVADDTAALQRAIDETARGPRPTTRVLYLPNGTYRVTQTLVVKSALGPWIYGETRDGVRIKLDDAVTGLNSVLRTHPNESGPTSADWFMRNIRNLTIDVGNNPEVDGIRWFATNTGILQQVRVTGRGKIGINAGFLGQSGPHLLQEVEVDGCEVGVRAAWIWGSTLSRVTIRNCREVGVYVNATPCAIEDLVVENTPQAMRCEYPNDWGWWGGVVALVGGRFSGGSADRAAIENSSIVYARDVQTSGFKQAVASKSPGGDVAGPNLDEYVSHPEKRLFAGRPGALRLPIRQAPDLPWETSPRRWVCANDHGAVAGDNKDDTAALQRAIDAAAAAGATTVYLRGVGGGDPKWYTLEGEVRLHGSVSRLLGLGFGRILGLKQGQLVIDDRSAPVVKVQHLDSFGGPALPVINRSANRTLVVESCGVTVIGDGGGDIIVTDCPARVELRRPGQKLWARHLNPEGNSDEGLVRNVGGDLWVLGVKHEGPGVRFAVSQNGRSEAFGMFLYGPGNLPEGDPRPIALVDNAQFSLAGLREIQFGNGTWPVKVRQIRGGETRELTSRTESGWTGWSLFSATAP
ncbi:MAG: glycoside hydrolase family 55 protein [Fimbriimonadaceae bacterium]|nr:glycoside hydrolase family 55 protein [Fimbriimonadaceae bacterium]